MAWKHRLSDIDLDNMTANCAHCGPFTPIVKADRIRCWVGRQKGGIYGDTKLTYAEKRALFGLEGERFCKVCNKSLSYPEAVLDHCHTSGKIRNFLCSNCNLGIGSLGDSPENLRRAAEYLENTKQWIGNNG